VVVVVLALVLTTMFAVLAHDIELSFHRVAAAHLQPAIVSVAVLGVGATLKASLADLPDPLLLVLTLAVLLASVLPVTLFLQKRRVLDSYNIAGSS
jgi:hypothetical protein